VTRWWFVEIRCKPCADRYPHRKPTLIGAAYLGYVEGYEGLQVIVDTFGRWSRRDLARRPSVTTVSRRLQPSQMLYGTRSVKLPCRSCKAQLAVVRERLRAWLDDDYLAVLIGANGEIVPVGAPIKRATRSSHAQG
jgi:hypothetical protein